MKKLYCFECDKLVNYYVEQEKNKWDCLDIKEIEVIDNVARCENCQAHLDHADIEDRNLDVLYEKFRRSLDKQYLEEHFESVYKALTMPLDDFIDTIKQIK